MALDPRRRRVHLGRHRSPVRGRDERDRGPIPRSAAARGPASGGDRRRRPVRRRRRGDPGDRPRPVRMERHLRPRAHVPLLALLSAVRLRHALRIRRLRARRQGRPPPTWRLRRLPALLERLGVDRRPRRCGGGDRRDVRRIRQQPRTGDVRRRPVRRDREAGRLVGADRRVRGGCDRDRPVRPPPFRGPTAHLPRELCNSYFASWVPWIDDGGLIWTIGHNRRDGEETAGHLADYRPSFHPLEAAALDRPTTQRQARPASISSAADHGSVVRSTTSSVSSSHRSPVQISRARLPSR